MSELNKIMTGLNAVDAMIERKNRRIIEQNETINRQANMLRGMIAVSYTHLTLPTKA